MRLPDFFIIGVAKGGTTAMHRYLGEHPDVFMSPIKEPGDPPRSVPSVESPPRSVPAVESIGATWLGVSVVLSIEFKVTAASLSGVWLSGGNVFVLRQAMRLSGFDKYIQNEQAPNSFTYGGYSAACCVLSPNLKPYSVVDDPNVRPYAEVPEVLWDGLGILDFAFMPHFQSNHSESELIEKEIDFCVANNISYRVFRDGEVLIL